MQLGAFEKDTYFHLLFIIKLLTCGKVNNKVAILTILTESIQVHLFNLNLLLSLLSLRRCYTTQCFVQLVSISKTFQCNLNGEFHIYNRRFKQNIRKSSAKRRWSHITTINSEASVWNKLDLSLRESKSLSVFKIGLSKAKF